jgi:tripartite-type tricarboxylate transporter receptor subunit TctC
MMQVRHGTSSAWIGILGIAAIMAFPAGTGAAEKPKDYPNRPIMVIVPGPAGGISDVGVRIMGESLKKLFGQPVLADNKAGAAGQIAYTDFKNNARPDGYTLAQVSSPHIHAITLDPSRKAIFTLKDFQPVMSQVQDPGAILVRPDSPFKTLEDLLAAAKANPGQIKVSSTGLGGDDHLAILNVQLKSGLRFNIIHTQGSPQAMAAVLGGHIDVNFDNIGGFLAPVKSGQARLLAVMMPRRHPEFPDVPTFREKGIDAISSSTRGYAVPAGTPMEIVRYLEESMKKGMEDPEHVKRAKDIGLDLVYMSTAEYGKFLTEQDDWVRPLIPLYRK